MKKILLLATIAVAFVTQALAVTEHAYRSLPSGGSIDVKVSAYVYHGSSDFNFAFDVYRKDTNGYYYWVGTMYAEVDVGSSWSSSIDDGVIEGDEGYISSNYFDVYDTGNHCVVDAQMTISGLAPGTYVIEAVTEPQNTGGGTWYQSYTPSNWDATWYTSAPSWYGSAYNEISIFFN